MKMLVVVDMQNDFIDGALGTPEAVAIVDNVKRKIEEYKSRGDEVIFTRDTHYSDYLTTQEGRNLPVVHCIKDADGWQISAKLDCSDCKIIDKPTFGSKELAEYVASANPDGVELVGLCTDICVISNAMLIKAFGTEIKVSVDSSCCAGVTPQTHLNALEAMKRCQIEVL